MKVKELILLLAGESPNADVDIKLKDKFYEVVSIKSKKGYFHDSGVKTVIEIEEI